MFDEIEVSIFIAVVNEVEEIVEIGSGTRTFVKREKFSSDCVSSLDLSLVK
jgi:hypothetical protein